MSRLGCLVAGMFLSSLASAANLQYAWEHSVSRVDGKPITGEREYVIRYSVDNVEQPLLTTPTTSYTLAEVKAGVYVAQIATSEDGVQGGWSETVTVVIGEVDIAAPQSPTFTVTFSCVDCNLEVKQ